MRGQQLYNWHFNSFHCLFLNCFKFLHFNWHCKHVNWHLCKHTAHFLLFPSPCIWTDSSSFQCSLTMLVPLTCFKWYSRCLLLRLQMTLPLLSLELTITSFSTPVDTRTSTNSSTMSHFLPFASCHLSEGSNHPTDTYAQDTLPTWAALVSTFSIFTDIPVIRKQFVRLFHILIS